MQIKSSRPPFIYGAQYYRAPTPEQEFWEEDLAKMCEMGFNTVKFWVQWRWSERKAGVYYWDDLDRLMDLAQENGLKVILNLILDVMPTWAVREYPDSFMVDSHGIPAIPMAVGCRQIGGAPGPCYSHPEMLFARQNFTRAALQHFKSHPALLMWDVWNEPENDLTRRSPDMTHLLCYCGECAADFREYLLNKYKYIENLNQIWGRCYLNFDEVELPRDISPIADFIDWREFHLDKLTEEANWRLRLVREISPERIPHLHVVPNTVNCFNYVTGVDDFAMSQECDIWGATMMKDLLFCAQAASAAGDKYLYNAEWHINFGSAAMHQRVIGEQTFLYEALPQLGWGIMGFMYWQYRSETLGTEAPAWGLVRGDGSNRPVTIHAERFIRTLQPYLSRLQQCYPEPARIGIFRSRRNELFHFCSNYNLDVVYRNLKKYAEVLYADNLSFRFIDSNILCSGIPEIMTMLILPNAYLLSEDECNAIDAFLCRGGVVVVEGHVAGYNSSIMRHSSKIPGCGLDIRWGITADESTSSIHVDCDDNPGPDNQDTAGDVRKALDAIGVQGGEWLPLSCSDGSIGYGGLLLDTLKGENVTILASYRDIPCIISKNIEAGTLFYSGTLLGIGAERDDALLKNILRSAANAAGISDRGLPCGVHLDQLLSPDGICDFMVITNTTTQAQEVYPPGECRWFDVFSKRELPSAVTITPLSSCLIARRT